MLGRDRGNVDNATPAALAHLVHDGSRPAPRAAEVVGQQPIEVGPLEFLCTALNEYVYRGVTYPVLDLAFVTRANSLEGIAALDGVESFCWIKPSEINSDEIAFPSIKAALREYIARDARPKFKH